MEMKAWKRLSSTVTLSERGLQNIAHEVELGLGYSVTTTNMTINFVIISIGAFVGFSNVTIGDIALGPELPWISNNLIQNYLPMQGRRCC